MNNYLTRENSIWAAGIIAALLILGLLGFWAASRNDTSPTQNLVDTTDTENATTSDDTPEPDDTDGGGEEGDAPETQSETRTASSGANNTAAAQQGATNSGDTAATSDNDDVEVSVELEQTGIQELGPRVAADSPAKALELLVEAMVAGDVDRAVSYFAPHVQEQYRTSFTSQGAPMAQHIIVRTYYNGTVEDVELVDPEYGIYEIAVYPSGSEFPYRPRFAYNAEAGEFVILEL